MADDHSYESGADINSDKISEVTYYFYYKSLEGVGQLLQLIEQRMKEFRGYVHVSFLGTEWSARFIIIRGINRDEVERLSTDFRSSIPEYDGWCASE
jgi:hypothetical protein